MRRSPSGVVATSANLAFAACRCRWMIAFGFTRFDSSSIVVASRWRRAATSASRAGMEAGAVAVAAVELVSGWAALIVSSLESEVATELRDVAGGLDVVEGVRDGAVLRDDHRAAEHPLDGLAVELLLPVGPPGVHHRAVGVGQQGHGQA